ncbi:putative holin-like toxin [Paenibacillus ferrarius]|nr:putative holin-like toxin [Paenibacillus ferrarius]
MDVKDVMIIVISSSALLIAFLTLIIKIIELSQKKK